jgi:hypothetical protein
VEKDMIIQTFEADTVSIRIPVTVQATGQPLDLTGAEIEVIAQRSGRTALEGVALVSDPPTGVVVAQFEPETFAPATYMFQCRITKDGMTQTVVNTQIRAAKSLRKPA